MGPYIEALAPIAHLIKAFHIAMCYGVAKEAWVHDMAVLARVFGDLAGLRLNAWGCRMPCHRLVEVVERLPSLAFLDLFVKFDGPMDVVMAALVAQQQAHAGRRTQQLTIDVRACEVSGGAEAVRAQLEPLLALGLWGPPMVRIVV